MESSVDPKPPNVLVYDGSGDKSDKNFQTLRGCIHQFLDCSDRYTLYPLTHKDIVQSIPWADNAAALMINCEVKDIDTSVQTAFIDFVKNGGQLLAFGPSVAPLLQQLSTSSEYEQSFVVSSELQPMTMRYNNLVDGTAGEFTVLANHFQCSSEFRYSNTTVIAESSNTHPVIMKVENNTGSAILSLARLDLTPSDADVQDLQVFNELKLANGSRCLLFTNLLKMLGLNVSPPSTVLPPTQCFLACTEMVFISNLCLLVFWDMFLIPQCQKALTRALQPVLEHGVLQGQTVSMQFCESDSEDCIPSDSELPVVFDRGVPEGHGFSWQAFERALKTRILGRALMYSQVIKSTQTLLDRLVIEHLSFIT